MEPICVAVLRQFYSLHPLRQILKFHCRGVLGTNKFNIRSLTGINGTSDRLFAIGYAGGYSIMRKAFDELSWDDTDFQTNIKVFLHVITSVLQHVFHYLFRLAPVNALVLYIVKLLWINKCT